MFDTLEIHRLKKLLAFSSLLFVFPSQASGHCAAQQQPREGYILTPDKVHLYYKVVGSGSEMLVAVHGGPCNSMESILDAGHISHVEQPEIFFKAVETFIKGNAPPDAKKVQSPQDEN